MKTIKPYLVFSIGLSLIAAGCSGSQTDPPKRFSDTSGCNVQESSCSDVVVSCSNDKIVLEANNQGDIQGCLRRLLSKQRFTSLMLEGPESMVEFLKVRLQFAEIHSAIQNSSIQSVAVSLPNLVIEEGLHPNDSLKSLTVHTDNLKIEPNGLLAYPGLIDLYLGSAKNSSLLSMVLPNSLKDLSVTYGKSTVAEIGRNIISCNSLAQIVVLGGDVDNICIPDDFDRISPLHINFSATYLGEACRKGEEWALKRRDSLAVKFPSISFFSGGF